MEQEKILGLILEKLESIDNRVGGLEAGQKSLESRMGGLENRMGGMENRMGGMENRMGGMEKRMSALENRVEAMAEDVAITRSATNTLLKWAERTDSIVNVGLYE